MIITNGLNEFYVTGKVTTMTVNYKGEKQLFYIDTDDLERVKQYTWIYMPSGGYAYSNELQTSLHRFILGIEDSNIIVDHISRRTNDNTKSNLRTVNHLENRYNAISNGKSGVKGIKWRKDRQRWYTDIRINGIKQGKSFTNFLDALEYRNSIYREVQGEYALRDECYELYSTSNEHLVLMLENEGYHYINYSNGTYIYILSDSLKQLLTLED